MVSQMVFESNEEVSSYISTLIKKFASIPDKANQLNMFKDILNILLVNRLYLQHYSNFRASMHVKIIEFLQDDFVKQDHHYVNLSNIMLRVIEELNDEQEHARLNNEKGIANEPVVVNEPAVVNEPVVAHVHHDNEHEYDMINDELQMIRNDRDDDIDYERADEDDDDYQRHIDEFN
jgi:hypothetical protein